MRQQHLVIIGGGFAGFWSAMSAARQSRALAQHDELKITLIAKEGYHTIRPRLYATIEPDLGGMRIPLSDYLTPLNINLIVDEVASIVPENRRISFIAGSSDIVYDALILAAGSQLNVTGIPGIEQTFNVDTFASASLLDRHLHKLSTTGFPTPSSRTFVVVGGGLAGLETVTALPQRLKTGTVSETEFNFFLIEKSPQLAADYAAEAQYYIVNQLATAGIHLLLGTAVESIDNGKIALTQGKYLDADTVIWTTGLRANPLTENFKGEHDQLGRLDVDKFLRLPGQPMVFAAGDVAKALTDEHHYAVLSCQHAIPQGKFAGHNAVNALFGQALLPYRQPRYTTCLDLGADNALFTVGWERQVKMVGAAAKALKTQIVTQWICPAPGVEETLKMSVPDVLQ